MHRWDWRSWSNNLQQSITHKVLLPPARGSHGITPTTHSPGRACQGQQPKNRTHFCLQLSDQRWRSKKEPLPTATSLWRGSCNGYGQGLENQCSLPKPGTPPSNAAPGKISTDTMCSFTALLRLKARWSLQCFSMTTVEGKNSVLSFLKRSWCTSRGSKFAVFFPAGHCLQERASERVPKQSCFVRNPDQQKKNQDTDSTLFQGNTQLLETSPTRSLCCCRSLQVLLGHDISSPTLPLNMGRLM